MDGWMKCRGLKMDEWMDEWTRFCYKCSVRVYHDILVHYIFLILYVTVNNLSVTSGRVFLG